MPKFDDNGRLDIEYYESLIVSQPKALITQLTPLLDNASTAQAIETQLQARYFIASAYYYLSQRSKIIPIAERGLELANAHDNARFSARFLGILAVGELSNRDFETATRYANQSLKRVVEVAPQTSLHGELLLLAAQVFYESGALQSALKVMVKANDIFTSLGDQKNRSEALASIALIYDELGQPEQALEYHLKSLELIDVDQNRVEASITYYNIALTYRNIDNAAQARHYAELSLKYAQEADDDIGAAYAIYELAYLDEDTGQLQRALAQVNKVLPVFEENNITGMMVLNHLLRARLRARLDLPGWDEDLAVAEPLVEKTPTLKRRIALVKTKAKVYEWVNEQTLALQYYKEWVALGEEQLNVTQEESTRRYQAMFELREAEAENELLNTQKKLAESELEAREFRQWLLIILSVALFLVLAAAITVLVMQIRTKTRFRQLALVDELTQTRNRRSISVFAEKALAAARTSKTDVCFAMVDIDHFKAFNDRFGHDVGDEVLKKVAATLSSELRARDALGRWGGEEWLIVLVDSCSDNVEKVFSRIQERLAQLTLGVEGAPSITISMGCTTLTPDDNALEGVIKRADEALYQAKLNGRNRYEVRNP